MVHSIAPAQNNREPSVHILVRGCYLVVTRGTSNETPWHAVYLYIGSTSKFRSARLEAEDASDIGQAMKDGCSEDLHRKIVHRRPFF